MNFRIIKNKKKFFTLSIILIALGLGSMGLNASNGKGALNYDIEFTGGTAMTVDMGGDVDNDDIAAIVTDVTGQKSPQIQKILGTSQVSIKIQNVESEVREELANAIVDGFSLSSDSILEVSDISGTISSEMQKSSLIAVSVACAVMLLYITIRFSDIKMGFSAIIALIHDVLIMISFYSIFRVPVNTAFIAAMLTVLGYSINSTIVIFDRLRENRKNPEYTSEEEIVEFSVWQTMRRSVYTSLTTLFTIGTLYILGVESVKEFALPIMVGVISGVYSSVFISGPLWEMMYKKIGEQNYEDFYESENEDMYVDPFSDLKPEDYE